MFSIKQAVESKEQGIKNLYGTGSKTKETRAARKSKKSKKVRKL